MVNKTSKLTELLSRNLLQVYVGTNWTERNLKDVLEKITYAESNHEFSFSASIKTLAFHLHYFAKVTLEALKTGKLIAHDRDSWKAEHIDSEEKWNALIQELIQIGKDFSHHIKGMTDEEMLDFLDDPKYGSTYDNVQGIIEHHHYHLGQISLLKNMIQSQ